MTKVLRIALKILSGAVTALLILIIAANIYLLAARKITDRQNATVFGFSSAVVLSGSMADAIQPNDLIITKSQKTYEIGDIIMFESGSATVTHRIIDRNAEGYITRGDANQTADETPVPPEKVIGRVIAVIPKIGRVISFFATPLGMLILVLALLLAIELPSLARRRNQKKGEAEAHEE